MRQQDVKKFNMYFSFYYKLIKAPQNTGIVYKYVEDFCGAFNEVRYHSYQNYGN